MLWSPNSRYRDVDAKVGGYTQYWPGAAWVDLVGMSLYSYGGYERYNQEAPANFVSDALTEFDGLFGSAQKKYMVLSETAASFVSLLACQDSQGRERVADALDETGNQP